MLEKFIETDPNKLKDMISLNCYPVTFINRFFVPILEKRRQTKGLKSAIINIASSAGVLSLPYFQVYCATKAYVDRLSTSLSNEYPQLDIISIRPSEVSTPMTCNKPLDIFTISAEDCARGILKEVGQATTSYGHWRHQLQGWLYDCVPDSLINLVFTKAVLPDDLKRRKQHNRWSIHSFDLFVFHQFSEM